MPIVLLFIVFYYYRLQSHMLTFRFQPKMYFPAYAIFYILYLFINYSSNWFPNLPLKFVFLILSSLYLFLLYTDSYGTRIFWIASLFIIEALCELTSALFLSTCIHDSIQKLISNSVYETVSSFIAAVLGIFITEAIIRKSKKRNFKITFSKEFSFLIFIDFLFIAVIAGLFYFDSSFLNVNTVIYLSLFVIIFISIVSFATLYKVAKHSKETMDLNLKLQKLEMEKKLSTNLADIVEDLRSLRHDMNNHLGILLNFLEIHAYQNALDYLRSILTDLKIANQYVFTENQMLSVLLNTKISRATALRIPIDTTILVHKIPLEDKDLCAIIGNLLDNAIEAAEKAEQPSISFSMQKEEDGLIIRCDNSFSKTPIFENGKLVTCKENKTLHGIGTQNIRSAAERYGGTVTFTFDSFFHACVTIPYSDF